MRLSGYVTELVKWTSIIFDKNKNLCLKIIKTLQKISFNIHFFRLLFCIYDILSILCSAKIIVVVFVCSTERNTNHLQNFNALFCCHQLQSGCWMHSPILFVFHLFLSFYVFICRLCRSVRKFIPVYLGIGFDCLLRQYNNLCFKLTLYASDSIFKLFNSIYHRFQLK